MIQIISHQIKKKRKTKREIDYSVALYLMLLIKLPNKAQIVKINRKQR